MTDKGNVECAVEAVGGKEVVPLTGLALVALLNALKGGRK